MITAFIRRPPWLWLGGPRAARCGRRERRRRRRSRPGPGRRCRRTRRKARKGTCHEAFAVAQEEGRVGKHQARTCRPCRPRGRRCARHRARPATGRRPTPPPRGPSVAAPNQTGTAPWTMMATTAVTTRSRSATGSSTLPTVDTWWKRRATSPSIQSVVPSDAEEHAAAVWSSRPNRSQRKSGRQARRISVMRLGTVAIRSASGVSRRCLGCVGRVSDTPGLSGVAERSEVTTAPARAASSWDSPRGQVY